MVEKLWRYVKPFSYKTSVSRTDGRTELLYQYRASAAVCWCAIKTTIMAQENCWKCVLLWMSHLNAVVLSAIMAYSSRVLPYEQWITSSPEWLPSSMRMRGKYSVVSDLPKLHVTRYDWFVLSAVSRQMKDSEVPLQLNGVDQPKRSSLLSVTREAGNFKYIGLWHWSSHVRWMVLEGSLKRLRAIVAKNYLLDIEKI